MLAVAWVVVTVFLTGLAGTHLLAQVSCDYAYNNFGQWVSHSCDYSAECTSHGTQLTCETDERSNGGTCRSGGGTIAYCVRYYDCGMFPGCNHC